LFNIQLFAQAKDPEISKTSFENGYDLKPYKIFFRAGLSSPRGEYESADINETGAGFADVGRQLEAGIEFRLKEVIAIVLRYSNLNHGMQESIFATALDNQLNSSIPGADFRTNIQFNNYRINSFLVSPRIFNKMGNNAYLTITPTIGRSQLKIGSLTATSSSGSGTIVTTQNETGPDYALVFGIGGGASFRLNEDISLNLFVEYLEANFEDISASGTVQASGQAPQNVPSILYDQKVQVLNFGIELGYNF
jgi:hypothetical protein